MGKSIDKDKSYEARQRLICTRHAALAACSFPICSHYAVVLLLSSFALLQNGERIVKADTSIDTVPVGSNPLVVAVNPVTNKTYVANFGSGTVTIIDGTNNSTRNVDVGSQPHGIAINTLTNKIYVTNSDSSSVSVIDGLTDMVRHTEPVGVNPGAIAVNPVTNKIYVGDYGSRDVVVIDGETDLKEPGSLSADRPSGIAVNPVTNKIYVSDQTHNKVTRIDAANGNDLRYIDVGTTPNQIVVNPVTNKVYVVQEGGGVTMIDGSTDTADADDPKQFRSRRHCGQSCDKCDLCLYCQQQRLCVRDRRGNKYGDGNCHDWLKSVTRCGQSDYE